ncbi:MAG: cytochrome C [Flavobacteriales bacterium]|jgi:mono/diheme cytochrome c family protein|nr:cytochrome C [Flavobacteriales bacterium]|tara:strand:+ start:494 stop:1093 length:600 start_codon:yes stop_codon:yes gene_type:complete
MLNKISYILVFMFVIITGCSDSASDGRPLTTHPGYEYMPDMYRSPSYETYSENSLFKNNSTAREPVQGTIPRGFVPFDYDNTLEDYLKAGVELINPLEVNSKNIEEGEVLYGMFCAHCHGKTGDGKGSIQHPLYGAVPSYSDDLLVRRSGTSMKDLSDGHMYHAITYGFNAMGGHASQINSEERWKIIMYVNELQKENN